MADYLPKSDSEFLAWSRTFTAYVTANSAALGLTAMEVASLSGLTTNFETAFAANLTAQQTAQAARQTKETALDNLTTTIRTLVRKLQASTSVTDTQRAAMGITVRDRVATAASAAGMTSRPLGVVDTAQRLRHEIRFTDEATPTRKAKPAGVMGCEIWVKVAAAGEPAPADPSQLQFLGLDTASPYTAEYPGSEAGKTAHYMLRWVNTRGDKGPWSETVSATIVG